MRDLLDSYTKEGIVLKQQITDICYYMKGGVEWESAWNLPHEDREIIIKRINKILKDQSPSGKEYM